MYDRWVLAFHVENAKRGWKSLREDSNLRRRARVDGAIPLRHGALCVWFQIRGLLR